MTCEPLPYGNSDLMPYDTVYSCIADSFLHFHMGFNVLLHSLKEYYSLDTVFC